MQPSWIGIFLLDSVRVLHKFIVNSVVCKQSSVEIHFVFFSSDEGLPVHLTRPVFGRHGSLSISHILSRLGPADSGSKAMQPMQWEHGLPLLYLSAAFLAAALLPHAAVAEGVTHSEALRLRDEVGLVPQIRHL